jgi:hypothetical protein
MTATEEDLSEQVKRAFGLANRERLLETYFAEVAKDDVEPATAWRHVYRLLIWIDRTIGLAHCYESDKAQPGRPWYARSLRFHKWLSDEFAVTPRELVREIDWLFGAAVRDLTSLAAAEQASRLTRGALQRRDFEHFDMPSPDEDPELEEMVTSAVAHEVGAEPSHEFARELVREIKGHLASENKRKNLVGEGFEDTLAALLRRWEPVSSRFEVRVRPPLHELPGFHPPRGNDKTKKVDLALIGIDSDRRVLVSCKWSVRSDREEQFTTDFDAYSSLESSGKTFEYVLVTNEFDPARLSAACENRSGNYEIFDHVVHVNPRGVEEALAAAVKTTGRAMSGQKRAIAHIESGRLSSLETWMASLP